MLIKYNKKKRKKEKKKKKKPFLIDPGKPKSKLFPVVRNSEIDHVISQNSSNFVIAQTWILISQDVIS